MIPEFTQALFLQALDEWGKYADNVGRLAPEQQADFLKSQGYSSLYELLAHVGVSSWKASSDFSPSILTSMASLFANRSPTTILLISLNL